MQWSVSTVIPASVLIAGPAARTVVMHLNTHKAGRPPIDASLIQTRTHRHTHQQVRMPTQPLALNQLFTNNRILREVSLQLEISV